MTPQWARHIAEAYPDIDGVRYNSRSAGDSLHSVARRIAGAARRLGYLVV